MKKILKNNIIKICVLSVTMIALFSFGHRIKAVEIVKNTNYTKEYKKWLELSEEERKKYIEPAKYSTNYIKNGKKDILYSDRSSFLEKYKLSDDIILNVKNQQQTGSCWAFSTTSVLETTLAKTLNRNLKFSPRHIEYSTSKSFLDGINSHGYNREVGDGGNIIFGLNYVTSGYGPVLEEEMPFENNEDKINLSEIENKNIPIMIDKYTTLPSIYKEYDCDGKVSKFTNGYEEENENRIEYTEGQVEEIRNQIKNHIYNYGAISTHTYMKSNKYLNKSDSVYEYYCNNGEELSNHAVTIVGWDDTYKKENFSSTYGQPAHDGAYLVLNSWGDTWSSNGYYYISYDDLFVENDIYGINEIDNKTYDKIYQHDVLGANLALGFDGTKTGYIANVFNREDTTVMDKLTKISFKIYGQNNVEIYVNSLGSELNKSKLTYIGKMDNVSDGYYTYKLSEPIDLQGDSYAIVLKCTNLKLNRVYFPVEAITNSGKWQTAVVGKGESYISSNGSTWEDTYDNNCNFCIKGFTNEYNNIKNITIEGLNNQYTYTGNEIKPEIKLKDGDKYLIENTDYKVTYSNNINVGTAKINIEGIGSYAGTTEKEYEITAKNLNTLSEISINTSNKEYTGNAIKTDISIKNENITLKENEDYTVSYQNNVNVGEATVNIKGIGNYTGNISDTFQIVPIDLSELNVVINTENKIYTGKEITTYVLVKKGSTTLILDKDYTISYVNNVEIGNATVKVKGIGNYSGNIERGFQIVSKDISSLVVSIDTSDRTYRGVEIKPLIYLWDSSNRLQENKDYTVNYDNNINVGTASITINGIGDYSGVVQRKFEIIPVNINYANSNLSDYNFIFDGTEKKPNLTIKYNNINLKLGIDYKIEFKNNINVGEAKLKIKGIGNYDNERSLSFWIYKAENTAQISAKNKNVKYKNVKKKKQNISPIKVYNPQGKVKYYKKNGNKNFTIDKNTGNITIKKKTKKGTYKIKIKINVDGNLNYYSTSKTLTITIKIK